MAVVLPTILLGPQDPGILSFATPAASEHRVVHARTAPSRPVTMVAARRAAPKTTSRAPTPVAVQTSSRKTIPVKHSAGIKHHAAKHKAPHAVHRVHKPKPDKPKAHVPKTSKPHGKAKKK